MFNQIILLLLSQSPEAEATQGREVLSSLINIRREWFCFAQPHCSVSCFVVRLKCCEPFRD